jgi:hypothetical protein
VGFHSLPFFALAHAAGKQPVSDALQAMLSRMNLTEEENKEMLAELLKTVASGKAPSK